MFSVFYSTMSSLWKPSLQKKNIKSFAHENTSLVVYRLIFVVSEVVLFLEWLGLFIFFFYPVNREQREQNPHGHQDLSQWFIVFFLVSFSVIYQR